MTQFPPVLAVPGTMTILQACAVGVLPMNAQLVSVNGVAFGAGAPCPTVAQILAAGNSGVSAYGVAIAPNAAINQQRFVDGSSAAATASTGPATTNSSSLTQAPVTGATLCSALVFTNGYGG